MEKIKHYLIQTNQFEKNTYTHTKVEQNLSEKKPETS